MVSVSPKSQSESSNTTTRCTKCHTVFELPPELLESADTRVRCGECLCIFDALAGMSSVELQEERAFADSPDAERISSGSPGGLNNEAAAASAAVDQLDQSLKANADEHRSEVGRKSESNDHSESHLDGYSEQDHSALDVTYSDFDLFSEDADLPALAYLDETRDTPEFDFDAVELGDDEMFSDSLFAHDVTINADLPIPEVASQSEAPGEPQAEFSKTESSDEIEIGQHLSSYVQPDVDFAVDKAPEEPLIFNYQDPTGPSAQGSDAEEYAAAGHGDVLASSGSTFDVNGASDNGLGDGSADIDSNADLMLANDKQRSVGPWVWFGGIAMLLAVLIATVIYPRWKSLDQSPRFRPMKVALCNVVGCDVETRVDLNQLKVLRREVYESADRENALVIDIAIQNTAEFAQRYPVVEVRMNNRVGRTVAQRAFKPSEYLSEWSRGKELVAGETVDISLVVNDPGNAAQDHVLRLRKLRLDCEPTLSANGRERWPADCAAN